MKIMRNNLKYSKGITVISLVLTIIILLILAGITIATLTGENGFINNANNAKKQTEIAEEKEIIDRATIEAIGGNKRGILTQKELQEQLDKITSKGNTEVSDVGDEFEVVFVDSNRYYIVDKNGNVGESQDIVRDKYPGNITIGIDGETLDGSEEHPYEIWCIEDLCDFSNRINNKNITSSYVMLMQTLDFKSNRSYVNGNITTEGLIKSCNSIEELKNTLMEGEGFTPIGILASTGRFEGTFEGNNKEIRNLYVNRDGYAGLFGEIFNANINNLGITGSVKSTNDTAGGIAGYADNSNYNNCYNKAIIVSNEHAGGIVGATGNSANINNCYNLGNVTAPNNAGGIAGRCSGKVEGCYNSGNIKSTNFYAGGLIGQSVRNY